MFASDFFTRNLGACDCVSSLPSCQRGPIPSCLILNTEMVHAEASGGARRSAARVLGEQKCCRSHYVGPTKKPHQQTLGMPHLCISPTGPQAPSTLCIAYPQPPPFPCRNCHHHVASSLFTLPWSVSTSLCRELVSMCRKPVQICRIGKKHKNFSIQHCPREGKWEADSTQLGFAGSGERIQS